MNKRLGLLGYCLHRGLPGVVVGLALLSIFLAPALSAPITSETQSAPQAAQATSPEMPQPAPVQAQAAPPESEAAVIEFSVDPSDTDAQTIIVVQQQGGKRVCVSHTAAGVIVRGYHTDADPFEPMISAEVRGLTTGNVGDLVGFNETKIYIRPRSATETFDPDECFVVGDYQGCFVPFDEECEEELAQGESLCVGTIASRDCDLRGHSQLLRQLRITVALNSPFGQSPIVTAAGLQGAAEVEDAGERLPSGSTGAAPGVPSDFSGSGGGGLLVVPNVVGLTLPAAEALIVARSFILGTVTEAASVDPDTFDGLLIKRAFAQACEPTVTAQNPAAGELRPAGTPINVTLSTCPAIPEPSALSLYVAGLLFLFVLVWHRRRAKAMSS